ncbi:hypothetical protein VMCG_04137 [Cytospora schulzeri]|uniref:Uncharacterized protein n=1 Tax=Cytospora schulzeri TaxID=448051 RepID=A0A423WUA0_9PEZI|nr:hypothetical protein VMCG_04137 [Valsa malicola]
MPRPALSKLIGKRYNDAPLIIEDDEDDEDSSGEDAPGEGYSAQGSLRSDAEESDPEQNDTEESDAESDGEESDGGGVHSFAEDQRQHTSSARSQTNPSPKLTSAPTSKTGTGIMKGSGTKLMSQSPRRPRNSATYNLLSLSRQAIGYSDYSPKKRQSLVLDQGSRRKSKPPTYNLKELVQRTRGLPSGTQKQANGVAKRSGKENASINGQTSGHVRKWRVSDDSDDEDILSKRQRVNPDTSIADSFASKGPDVTNTTIQKRGSASKSVANGPGRDDVVPPMLQEPSALLQYIIPWIHQGGGVLDPNGITDDERIANMLALPMQRTIEWNNDSRNRWGVSAKIDIVALLMQLTGEDSPTPCDRCASDPKYGQWVGCKVMSSKMVGDAWRIYGCANCVYHGKQTYCSLKSWSRKRAPRETAPSVAPKKQSRDRDAEVKSSEDMDQSEASAAETTTAKAKTAQNHNLGHAALENNDGTTTRARPTQNQDASLVSVGGSLGSPLIMEPWEKAPGRIRSRNSETMENIAFSKSYLANGHEISVCREAAFRVEIIRSGHSKQLRPQKDTMCLCSIASGKLTVKMDGEDPFTIGTHGMFRILPGSRCLVDNEIYDDVTMHVTSIRVEAD